MSLVKWNPFGELEDVWGRYSNLRRNYLSSNDTDKDGFTVADWIPGVDISEKKEAYYIKAELPGVSKNDVGVSLEKGVLTIRGEKRYEKETDKGKTHRVECSYGQFVRSFKLPESVQEDRVEASYENGVLNLVIPKSPDAQPKAIEIKVK